MRAEGDAARRQTVRGCGETAARASASPRPWDKDLWGTREPQLPLVGTSCLGRRGHSRAEGHVVLALTEFLSHREADEQPSIKSQVLTEHTLE